MWDVSLGRCPCPAFVPFLRGLLGQEKRSPLEVQVWKFRQVLLPTNGGGLDVAGFCTGITFPFCGRLERNAHRYVGPGSSSLVDSWGGVLKK